MEKISQVARRAACPAYDDLIRYSDTGERERLKGHARTAYSICSHHLEEYQALRHMLVGLKDVQDDAGESLRKKVLL